MKVWCDFAIELSFLFQVVFHPSFAMPYSTIESRALPKEILKSSMTDGKAEVGKVGKRKSEKKEDQRRERKKQADQSAQKGRKAAKHPVFPMI